MTQLELKQLIVSANTVGRVIIGKSQELRRALVVLAQQIPGIGLGQAIDEMTIDDLVATIDMAYELRDGLVDRV
jgi:hypothetical protein